jgi:D-3-phosphoglycerate dehydrogenase
VKPLVIQTENLPQVCSDWLAERVDLHVCPSHTLRFQELLPKAHGLVIRTYTEVNSDLIERAPNLQVVGRAGVGVDNIDLMACSRRGIQVVHTPEANSEAVVEFTLAAILPKLRSPHKIQTALDIEEWKLHRESSICEQQFDQMTLGIIGFGRVGSKLGRIAKAIGFRVMYYDLKQIKNQTGCEQVELPVVLKESHIVSVHIDGRIENKGIFCADVFSQMREDVLFVNTSRGFVVEAKDLAAFLDHHKQSFAILDVHDPEPFTSGYPLLGKKNVDLYPHVAAKTKTAIENMGWVVRDVAAALAGEKPKFPTTL